MKRVRIGPRRVVKGDKDSFKIYLPKALNGLWKRLLGKPIFVEIEWREEDE